MTERAAHLIDHVLPRAPVRQWVLSLPFELRYRLASDHPLCRAVLAVYTRALQGFYRKRAKVSGHRGGRRRGDRHPAPWRRAQLERALHTLVLDGVFVREPDGSLSFAAAKAPTDEESNPARRYSSAIPAPARATGLVDSWRGPRRTRSPLHALRCVRPSTGRHGTTRRCNGAPPRRRVNNEAHLPERSRQARLGGFDLHANTSVRAKNCPKLERLCRYLLRPPVAEDRLSFGSDGNVLVRLKTPWRDGTSTSPFQPLELLEKLAALIPRPYVNLIVYHGVLAPNAKWRREVVDFGRPRQLSTHHPPPPRRRSSDRHNRTWAELMRRGLDIDVLECPNCGGRLRFVAAILLSSAIRRILRHLGLPSDPVQLAPARAPPELDDAWAC